MGKMNNNEQPLFLEKVTGAAIPENPEARKIFNSFKIGHKFEILPWSDRNRGFHKKMFSLLGVVCENNTRWKNSRFLLGLIQIDIGNVDIGKDLNGNILQIPKSISFRKMSEPEFTKLFSDVIDYMLANLEVLVPGMPEERFNMFVQRILNYT